MELGIASNCEPNHKKDKTNIEATNPDKTTRLALLWPYNSEIRSVTKKVRG
jgi:hypothetical protein